MTEITVLNKLALGACILVLTGCSDRDSSDLERFIAEVKARPKTAIEPLPKMKVIEPFLFDPTDLRNPFVPMAPSESAAQAAMVTGNGIQPDFSRPREELENYPLDSLRLVGTVTKDSLRWGLIKAGDGTIHRVKEGNFMGKNHGRIIRVSDNQAELMEIVPDVKPGTWREQQTTIALVE